MRPMTTIARPGREPSTMPRPGYTGPPQATTGPAPPHRARRPHRPLVPRRPQARGLRAGGPPPNRLPRPDLAPTRPARRQFLYLPAPCGLRSPTPQASPSPTGRRRTPCRASSTSTTPPRSSSVAIEGEDNPQVLAPDPHRARFEAGAVGAAAHRARGEAPHPLGDGTRRTAAGSRRARPDLDARVAPAPRVIAVDLRLGDPADVRRGVLEHRHPPRLRRPPVDPVRGRGLHQRAHDHRRRSPVAAGASEIWTHDQGFVTVPGLRVWDPFARC